MVAVSVVVAGFPLAGFPLADRMEGGTSLAGSLALGMGGAPLHQLAVEASFAVYFPRLIRLRLSWHLYCHLQHPLPSVILAFFLGVFSSVPIS